MTEEIALIFSDFHLANWKQFNNKEYRLKVSLIIAEQLCKIAWDKDIDVLFSGDLIDHPKHMDNIVMEYMTLIDHQIKLSGHPWLGIDGNHDLYKINTFDNRSNGYFSHLSKLSTSFICVNFQHYDTPTMRVHGIPYLNHNIGFVDAVKQRVKHLSKDLPNILLIHRDLAGALEPDGKLVKKDKEGDRDLKKLFKKFDLVISGHIHKPQEIKALGKNVLMAGATNHQRRSDKNCEMGYWILYSNMKRKFFPLDTPKFRTYKDGEEPENDTDFWVKLPKEISDKEGKTSTQFDVKKDRKKLVKQYFKVKGIKSKRKLHKLISYVND